MVHLTYNGTERRKTPSPLKIELFARYHSETPCKVCPNHTRTAGEDTAETIPAYQIGTNRSSYARIIHFRKSAPCIVAARPDFSLSGSEGDTPL